MKDMTLAAKMQENVPVQNSSGRKGKCTELQDSAGAECLQAYRDKIL